MRDLLGHASITTTERYDNQKLDNLQAAAARLERRRDVLCRFASRDDFRNWLIRRA